MLEYIEGKKSDVQMEDYLKIFEEHPVSEDVKIGYLTRVLYQKEKGLPAALQEAQTFIKQHEQILETVT